MQNVHHRVKSWWLVVLPAGLAIVAIAFARLTTLTARGWDVAWTAAAVSTLTGTLLGRRAAAGWDRSRWTLWAAATGCWLFGQLAWDRSGSPARPIAPTSPTWGGGRSR